LKSPLIQLENVAIQFGSTPVLSHITMSLYPGEIITLIGPNGAGKTSLIRAILNLASISEGQIIRRPNVKIGYMPQKLQVDSTLPITVERFLRLTRTSRKKVDIALDEMGISHLKHHPLQDISGGELQRTLLTRAIILKPALLVLDEPAQGVDVSGQVELYSLIKNVRDRLQCGVLMVSHDLHLVMSSTDRVICLNKHICCSGHPEQITQDPAYLALFGAGLSNNMAIYQHHHNHKHDIHGDIIFSDGHSGIVWRFGYCCHLGATGMFYCLAKNVLFWRYFGTFCAVRRCAWSITEY